MSSVAGPSSLPGAVAVGGAGAVAVGGAEAVDVGGVEVVVVIGVPLILANPFGRKSNWDRKRKDF